MHPYKRSQRVGDLLREEISEIIMNRLKDPRIGFITVTGATMTEDLKIARVYISVLKREDTQKTLDILNGAAGFIRRETARNVKLKFIPQLEFYEDTSIAYGEKIDSLLKQVKGEDQ